MLVAIGERDNGRRLLVLGLSRGNIEKLLEGRPIALIEGRHPSTPKDYDVLITFGETEESIAQEICRFVDLPRPSPAPPDDQ